MHWTRDKLWGLVALLAFSILLLYTNDTHAARFHGARFIGRGIGVGVGVGVPFLPFGGLFNRSVNVNVVAPPVIASNALVQAPAPVSITNVRTGLFGTRVHQVNIGQPAFVNSQVLVNPAFRGQLNQLNSYTYTPANTAANIRFVQPRRVLLQAPPIVAAPIIEHRTYVQPGQTLQRVIVQPQSYLGPQSMLTVPQAVTDPPCAACQRGVAPADPGVQYQLAPQAQPQVQLQVQPQVQYYTQPQQQLAITQGGCSNPAALLAPAPAAVYAPDPLALTAPAAVYGAPLGVGVHIGGYYGGRGLLGFRRHL